MKDNQLTWAEALEIGKEIKAGKLSLEKLPDAPKRVLKGSSNGTELRNVRSVDWDKYKHSMKYIEKRLRRVAQSDEENIMEPFEPHYNTLRTVRLI